MSNIEIRQNEAERRFETEVDGKLAVLEYMPAGNAIAYVHTEVPEDLEGRGIGSALAKHALDYARENELGVIPTCPFVIAYIRDHQEYRDLVTSRSSR